MMKTFNDIWETTHQNESWGKYPSELVIQFMARNYYKSIRKDIKVLDLGCGAGSNTWYLATEGFNTFAIDGSATAIKKTCSCLAERGLSACVTVADAANLDFPDDFFDVIIDSGLICANTSQGIESILSECCRVLKKGGQLFSTVLFTTKTTGFGTGDLVEKNTYVNITKGPLENKGTAHFFEEPEIEDFFCRKSGFSLIAVDEYLRTEFNRTQIVSFFSVIAKK